MRAKKSLGQHFLHSQKALSQITDAARPAPNDIILEIGPGTGALTKKLLPRVGKVLAVEKDRDMIALLEEEYSKDISSGHLSIIEGDILEFDVETLRSYTDHTYKLVANIPYYITGAIIEKFLSAAYQPTLLVLLMQREVAERIIARDKKESILSIAVKAYGTPKIIDRVPPGAFNPPPTVESAILLIDNVSRDFFAGCDEKLFFSVLKAVFGKKRKQIEGTLAEFLDNREAAQEILQSAGLPNKARPEDLTLSDWKKLAILLAERKNSVQ